MISWEVVHGGVGVYLPGFCDLLVVSRRSEVISFFLFSSVLFSPLTYSPHGWMDGWLVGWWLAGRAFANCNFFHSPPKTEWIMDEESLGAWSLFLSFLLL